MDPYHLVDCPCQIPRKHRHKIGNLKTNYYAALGTPVVDPIKNILHADTEETHEKNVYIAHYVCDISNHKCKVWVLDQYVQYGKSECVDCKYQYGF